jgi:Asp/Glu/hydantoin racemase
MKILIINPNTSESMTEKIRAVAEAAKRDDCEVTVICPARGPVTLESSYDEAYAIAPTIDLVKQANEEDYDAIILACFCEVGVEAAKEISSIPVFGLEETTLSVALLLGAKFGILTEKRPRVAMKELLNVWLQSDRSGCRWLSWTLILNVPKPREWRWRVVWWRRTAQRSSLWAVLRWRATAVRSSVSFKCQCWIR